MPVSRVFFLRGFLIISTITLHVWKQGNVWLGAIQMGCPYRALIESCLCLCTVTTTNITLPFHSSRPHDTTLTIWRPSFTTTLSTFTWAYPLPQTLMWCDNCLLCEQYRLRDAKAAKLTILHAFSISPAYVWFCWCWWCSMEADRMWSLKGHGAIAWSSFIAIYSLAGGIFLYRYGQYLFFTFPE